LWRLESETPFPRLENLGARLEKGLNDAIAKSGKPARINRVGSMFTVFFTDKNVTDFDSAKSCDVNRFNAWFHSMLNQGIYLPPSQFEAAFISAAHTEDDIDRTIASAGRALHA